jgi:hypothetical protein
MNRGYCSGYYVGAIKYFLAGICVYPSIINMFLISKWHAGLSGAVPMDMETYSGDNFSPGLLPGEQSGDMEDEDDYEAGMLLLLIWLLLCCYFGGEGRWCGEQQYSGDNFSPGLLPGEQSGDMDDEDDHEAGMCLYLLL